MKTILCTAAVNWIEAAAAPADAPSPLPRFNMTAYTGGAMRLAGRKYPLVVDLSGLDLSDQRLPIRLQHDSMQGVGHTDRLEVVNGQLLAEGVISRATKAAADVVASGRNGYPWQASIGASGQLFEHIPEGASVLVNGQTIAGPVDVVRKAALGEISFVDRGADNRTSASLAAAAAQHLLENPMDLSARCAALVAKTGEKHKAKIQDLLIAGKEDCEIAAEIEAESLKAERESMLAAQAATAAEIEQLKAQVATLTTEKAALVAQVAAAIQSAPAPVGGQAGTLTKEEWAKLPPAERTKRRHELSV